MILQIAFRSKVHLTTFHSARERFSSQMDLHVSSVRRLVSEGSSTRFYTASVRIRSGVNVLMWDKAGFTREVHFHVVHHVEADIHMIRRLIISSISRKFLITKSFLGWRTSQPRSFQSQASTPDFSTPDFSAMNFSTPDFSTMNFWTIG